MTGRLWISSWERSGLWESGSVPSPSSSRPVSGSTRRRRRRFLTFSAAVTRAGSPSSAAVAWAAARSMTPIATLAPARSRAAAVARRFARVREVGGGPRRYLLRRDAESLRQQLFLRLRISMAVGSPSRSPQRSPLEWPRRNPMGRAGSKAKPPRLLRQPPDQNRSGY